MRQAGIEEKAKWLVQLVSDRVVDVHRELLEEGLIEAPARVVVSIPIGGLAA